MKEDIKRIEKFISDIKECGLNDCEKNCFDFNLLRNLLTRYKQLEEENKSKQKAYDDCYCEYKHYKQFDSIPKSKVKKKIEELKEIADEDNQDEYIKIQVLQEVLGEE